MLRLATLALCFFLAPASFAAAGQHLPLVPLPPHAVAHTASHAAYPAPRHAPRSLAAHAYTAPRGVECWQSYTPLYGKYSVAFCLGPRGKGSYRIMGAGYDCRGQSRWSGDGAGLDYRMSTGTCGAQSDWSADRIRCRPAGARGHNLACTYAPVVAGHGPTQFRAFKQ